LRIGPHLPKLLSNIKQGTFLEHDVFDKNGDISDMVQDRDIYPYVVLDY